MNERQMHIQNKCAVACIKKRVISAFIPMTLNSSHFLLLLVSIALLFPVKATTAGSGNELSLTGAFVDVYDCWYRTVLATSDGGATLASIRYSTNSPRVVKVSSEGRFVWFSEQRLASGDSASYWYYPMAIVEDSASTYIYVAGYIAGPTTDLGYIIKYKHADGTFVASATFSKSASYNSYVYTLILDTSGDLFFGGAYCTDPDLCTAWAGTISSSTLALSSEHVVTSVYSTPSRILKLVLDQSTGYYVIAGTMDTTEYLWLAGIDSAWTLKWEYACVTCTYSYTQSLVVLGTGSYMVLDGASTVYTINAGSGFVSSAGTALSGTMAMAASSVSGIVTLAGYTSTSQSFVADYDPGTDCEYPLGAQYGLIYFEAASKHTSQNSVWVAGYLFGFPPFSVLAKISPGSITSCSSGYTNYFNSGCYLSSTFTGCFGLCATCLLASDINACSTPAALARSDAVSIFAGRCATEGYHYSDASASCAAVVQASCHPLCGGECLSASDSAQCAHHCHGSDPYVDDSGLAKNKCACKTGYAYMSGSGLCEACSPFCGAGGCVLASDNTQCVDCVIGATSTPTSGSTYFTCTCPSQTVLSSGQCKSCYVLCNGCTAPGDQTKCLACASGVHILASVGGTTCVCGSGYVLSSGVCAACHPLCATCSSPGDSTQCVSCASTPNVQAAATSTCVCIAGTTYDSASGLCVYTSGCHSLCLGKCTTQSDSSSCVSGCNPTAQSESTSSIAGVYQCVCADGTAFGGESCLLILDSGCSALCESTCVSASRCIAGCQAQRNVVTTKIGYFFNCSCAEGTELVGSICAYQEGCSSHCGSGYCTVQSNASACLGCAAGITPVEGENRNVTCECPSGEAYFNASCVTILNTTCSPLCNNTCVSANDPTACLFSCSSSRNVVTNSGSADAVNCSCSDGTRLIASYGCVADLRCDQLCDVCLDNYTCLACPEGGGMTLSGGKCICASSEGYVMVTEDGKSRCVKKSSTASSAIQAVG